MLEVRLSGRDQGAERGSRGREACVPVPVTKGSDSEAQVKARRVRLAVVISVKE